MSKYILEVEKLSKSFRQFKLKDINFTISKGAIVGLIGKKGAGKTSLIKAIMKMTDIDYGKIIYDGSEDVEDIKHRIAYISKCERVYADIKLADIRKLMSELHKNHWNETMFLYLAKDVFNLNLDTYVKDMPKDMTIKFWLTLSLARESKLIIIDDISKGVSNQCRDEILDILKWVNSTKGTTILLLEEDYDDVSSICTDYIHMDNGKISTDRNGVCMLG